MTLVAPVRVFGAITLLKADLKKIAFFKLPISHAATVS
jgi:hypothetical protein